MKQMVLFLLIFLFGVTAAAQLQLSCCRVDPDVSPLVRRLAIDMIDSKESFILEGVLPTSDPYLHEIFRVFEYKGKRFSLYYQWDVREPISLDNQEYFAIYVRPIGTTDPESLLYFKDYHLNGSWDECGDSGIQYSWEYFEGSWFDEERQKQFIATLKEALEYIN